MMDHQVVAMEGGEGEVTHKLAPVPSMETSQGPRNLEVRVVEELATTWQREAVFCRL